MIIPLLILCKKYCLLEKNTKSKNIHKEYKVSQKKSKNKNE